MQQDYSRYACSARRHPWPVCMACSSVKSASFVYGQLDSSYVHAFMDYPGCEIYSCAIALAGLCVRSQSSMFAELIIRRLRWKP